WPAKSRTPSRYGFLSIPTWPVTMARIAAFPGCAADDPRASITVDGARPGAGQSQGRFYEPCASTRARGGPLESVLRSRGGLVAQCPLRRTVHSPIHGHRPPQIL